MKNIILIPFVYGFGKSGYAKTGLKHAMLKETFQVPYPMNDYKSCIIRNKQPQDNIEQIMSVSNKFFLFNALLDESKQIFEFSMPNGETLLFFNYNTVFPSHSISFNINIKGQNIEIKR